MTNGNTVLWVTLFFIIVLAFEAINLLLAAVLEIPVPDDLEVESYIFALLMVYLLRKDD